MQSDSVVIIPTYNAKENISTMILDTGGFIAHASNGEILVYTSDRNAYYHRASSCPNASGINLLPTHLGDALLDGKTRCPLCDPPEPVLEEEP